MQINLIAVFQAYQILCMSSGLQNVFQPIKLLVPGFNGREVAVPVPWGEIRGREWGSEDGVPWIGNIPSVFRLTFRKPSSSQPYTGGLTMLELLSPLFHTSPKDTGAAMKTCKAKKMRKPGIFCLFVEPGGANKPLLAPHLKVLLSDRPATNASKKLKTTTLPMKNPFRLLCIDLPGHGLSSHIPPGGKESIIFIHFFPNFILLNLLKDLESCYVLRHFRFKVSTIFGFWTPWHRCPRWHKIRYSSSSGHGYHYLENLDYVQRVARHQVSLISGPLIFVGSRVGTLLAFWAILWELALPACTPPPSLSRSRPSS